jgi:hypothetical protein
MISYLVAFLCLFFLAVDWVVLDRARFSLRSLLIVMTSVAVVIGTFSAVYHMRK